ncbi:MAG TPA: MarR family transcriptional regulator [Pyrinomonadaceae bacterium]|jgi:DNA-binding MarR family transcriptional regulator
MARRTPDKLEEILNSFAEVMSMILLELHQQHLAELDLTVSQAQALKALKNRGQMPTGQLAAELRISAPAITQLTDRLVRKNLIARQTAEGDRRTVLVALSVKGKRLMEQMRKRRCEIFSRALQQLDEVEREEVTASLEKVIAALEEYESKLAIESERTASNTTRK